MKMNVIILISIFCATVFSADESRFAITIYNNDLALVREIRQIDLQKGAQEFRYVNVAAQIDPSSVHFATLLDPGSVTILEQNFEYDLVGTSRLLDKYINADILVTSKEKNIFTGQLQNADGGDVILLQKDGQVKVVKTESIETIEFPNLPAGLFTRPTLIWQLDSKKAGKQNSEISYLTHGLSWNAEYVALVNRTDTAMDLGAWVSIQNNAGATFKDALLKLVAGDINVAAQTRVMRKLGAAQDAFMAEAAPQFEEKAFFEYHMYTLQRPATIKDRQMKQISLFPNTHVNLSKNYIYDCQNSMKDVGVYLEFKNAANNGLGIPLPAGQIRIFKEDQDESQEFIGEDNIDHTAKDEQVRIKAGNAFDIVGERIVKSSERINDRSRRETIVTTIRNHKPEPIDAVIVEHFWGDWEFVGKTPQIIKQDANKVEFRITVAKDSYCTL
jgi:hypothetical protein